MSKAMLKQIVITRVRLFGAAEPTEHPNRPGPTPVARRVNPASEGILAWLAQVARVVEVGVGKIRGIVEPLDRARRGRHERPGSLAAFRLDCRIPSLTRAAQSLQRFGIKHNALSPEASRALHGSINRRLRALC